VPLSQNCDSSPAIVVGPESFTFDFKHSCSCAKEQKKYMKIAKVALARLSEFIAASKFAALCNNNILIKPKHPNLDKCSEEES
jgi:hypothetical protein